MRDPRAWSGTAADQTTHLGGVVFRLEDIPSHPPDVPDPILAAFGGGTAPVYRDHLGTQAKSCLAHVLPNEAVSAEDDHLTAYANERQSMRDSQ